MKPQLTLLDSGEHNRDLDATRIRLEKGASWKNQRVVVILPAGEQVPTKAAMAWRNLWFPPNQANTWILAQGYEVGEAYSNAIQSVLDHPELSKWEYILTVEHDNIPPPDGCLKLIKQMEAHPEYACIGGLYFTKGPEGVAQIWGDAKDPILNFRPQVPVAGQLIECNGTGMGFNLFRMEMFKDTRLRKPWFKTLNGTEGQGIGTQDLYFWGDAKKYYRCAIDCDVRVGHYDWKEDITW